jgi:hypothetical protein
MVVRMPDSAQAALRRIAPLVRERSYLIWIFLIALTLRVTYNLTAARGYVPGKDAAEYIGLAQHLLHWGATASWRLAHLPHTADRVSHCSLPQSSR